MTETASTHQLNPSDWFESLVGAPQDEMRQALRNAAAALWDAHERCVQLAAVDRTTPARQHRATARSIDRARRNVADALDHIETRF
jgi:hypothetical protein